MSKVFVDYFLSQPKSIVGVSSIYKIGVDFLGLENTWTGFSVFRSGMAYKNCGLLYTIGSSSAIGYMRHIVSRIYRMANISAEKLVVRIFASGLNIRTEITA